IGIEVEELERVFEPFVQSQHRNHLIEGTGLGLPISRCFAQLMGGDIQIQSLVGEGTIVRFEVEVALAPPQAVPSPGFSRQVIGIAPNQPTYRILVVEDHLESRNLLQNLLQGLGFEVQTAHNGQEAIAQWQNWHPHLIWMDIRLPEMDGCEATQRIRAMERIKASTRPPTKILALTANAFEEERTKVLAAGCNDFVRKPVLEEMLLSKMSKHLGVQFIYREVARSCPSPAIFLEEAPLSVHEVKSCLSSIMPKDWIQAFHQAAHLGSDERLLHLIGQIPLAHSRLIQTLTSLVRNFCFDQLLDVSQSPVQ
ncbi:MAG: response regulator, partial [Leptolyngbyaceae cyanobacterium bins.59]|nr:response regulator [Leptolyngbyaceae cyanobacterium bins.59]